MSLSETLRDQLHHPLQHLLQTPLQVLLDQHRLTSCQGFYLGQLQLTPCPAQQNVFAVDNKGTTSSARERYNICYLVKQGSIICR